MKKEESSKLKGAEMYHNNIVTNKDGQIQTLRNLEGSDTTPVRERVEGGMVPICREVSRSEGRGYKASVGRLRSHLNREETAASNLRSCPKPGRG